LLNNKTCPNELINQKNEKERRHMVFEEECGLKTGEMY
jgi:hypothetical protein